MQVINVAAIWIGYSVMIFAIVAVVAMPIVYGVMASVGLWNFIARHWPAKRSGA